MVLYTVYNNLCWIVCSVDLHIVNLKYELGFQFMCQFVFIQNTVLFNTETHWIMFGLQHSTGPWAIT